MCDEDQAPAITLKRLLSITFASDLAQLLTSPRNNSDHDFYTQL